MRTAPYKIVQWATGNVGTRSLRSVIEHPNMRLVGLYVHSKDKAGAMRASCAGSRRSASRPRTPSMTSSR